VLPGTFSFWHAMLKSKSQFYAVKTPAFLLLPMILLGKLLKRKIIFWSQMDHDSEKSRESVPSMFSKIQDACLPKVDLIISQTQKQALGYQNNIGLESTVISSIASIDEIDCSNSESDYLLWVGNSSPKKRQEVFIELAKQLPDQKCVMAMNIACQDRFDAARQDAESIDNLTFLGSIKPAETQKWFKHACVYVHTATKEGFPNTFLQAWSNGIPVVSLNIDPDGQINKNNLGQCIGAEHVMECGENPQKLAELLVPTIQHYLLDPSSRKEAGLNAIEYVSKNHSPKVVVDNLIKVLLKND
jgi:glycosyltransferase involved in cell wall biosynthesis